TTSTRPGSTLPTVAPPSTTTTTGPKALPQPAEGDAAGTIEIPKINKTGSDIIKFVQGISVEDLRRGPGHYPDTVMPGEKGNAAIAGHRTTYGAPFGDLDKLE